MTTPTQGEHAQTELAHELFAAAQLAPGEGIEDAVSRIAAALTAPTAQPAAPQGVAYAELPEGWPARFRCDSCDGNGEVGEPISMGHFQPPERERCPDCDGRGWCSEEPAFSADDMRDFADRTHALRASNGQAPAGATAARSDALCDSSYVAGAKAGFNLGVGHDYDALSRLVEGRHGYLQVLAATRPLPAPAAQAAPAGVAVGVVRWAAGIEGSQLEVRWKDGEAPPAGTQVYAQTTTAQAAPAADLQPNFTQLRKALADRRFRGDTDLQDLVNMAANIIAEDGDVISGQRGIIDKLKTAPAAGAVAGLIYCIRTKKDVSQLWRSVSEQEYRYALTMPDIFDCETLAPTPAAQADSEIFERRLQAIATDRDYWREQAQKADSVLEDAAFEAVRKKLCALPRYSFVLDDDGLVRRVLDRSGNWIEFDEAHALFDPISVDAARKQGGA